MYAVRRPVDNVYLVRERDRRRTRELLALLLAVLPPMAVLFAAVWANLETVRLGYQIEHLQRQRDVLVERRRHLEMERAQAASFSRVERIAREALNLGAPRPDQVILVRDTALPGGALSAPLTAQPGFQELAGPPVRASTEEGF